MKLLILGANGRVGTLLVQEALERGHGVVAFVHGPRHPFKNDSKLLIIQGEVYSKDDIANACSGVDAVLSALGSWGSKRKNVLATAMSHLIPSMKANNIKRIVSLTGADARDSTDANKFFNVITRPLLLLFARKILLDGESHIAQLRSSRIAWTVVRSPVMKHGTAKGYELISDRPFPWASINRIDVVNAMLDCVEQNIFVRQSPFIAKK